MLKLETSLSESVQEGKQAVGKATVQQPRPPNERPHSAEEVSSASSMVRKATS